MEGAVLFFCQLASQELQSPKFIGGVLLFPFPFLPVNSSALSMSVELVACAGGTRFEALTDAPLAKKGCLLWLTQHNLRILAARW